MATYRTGRNRGNAHVWGKAYYLAAASMAVIVKLVYARRRASSLPGRADDVDPECEKHAAQNSPNRDEQQQHPQAELGPAEFGLRLGGYVFRFAHVVLFDAAKDGLPVRMS